MAKRIEFPISDLIAGYVVNFDQKQDQFTLKTSDDREFTIQLTPTVNAELLRNSKEIYQDATSNLRNMLTPGRFLNAYGVFYPDGADGEYLFEAKRIVFVGRTPEKYRFEEKDWWINQIKELADFYLASQFGDGKGGYDINYKNYRTDLSITGSKQSSVRQETDTISRLVYGFASAYMLTGNALYLEAAEKGTQYLQDNFCFRDKSEGICYWYHAIDIQPSGVDRKIYTSESGGELGDDYHAIPCYEQIYALAGLAQTYRVTGNPAILKDIKATVRMFNRYFKDSSEQGGFFSHIDPITFSPRAESLGKNRARKNWNSVGDHAPAYLINLYLATGDQEYADFLEYTFDAICDHFPDFSKSPFVQERFFENWSADREWSWQQDRAVVGHNLKIAWNLTRMFGLKPKQQYRELAEKIGTIIPEVGCDRQRGGWYDVLERALQPGQKFHRFVWHDRKAWWQQEQGILAYYIMKGVYDSNPDFLRYAREGASFYNAWFLDNESGGVYFNVLANGMPYAVGTERGKGSHSMSGYHSFELCFLSATYSNLLLNQEPMDLYFNPQPGGFVNNQLRVAPDILPGQSIKLHEVWINGQRYNNFDPENLVITLPEGLSEIKVQVRVLPVGVGFSAESIKQSEDSVLIRLTGNLTTSALRYLKEELEKIDLKKINVVTLDASGLTGIAGEASQYNVAVRYLEFFKQKAGPKFQLTIVGASEQVRRVFDGSSIQKELTLV